MSARHRALVLGATGSFSARILNAWLDAGHQVVEFWRAARESRGALEQDRRWSWLSPRWSTAATLRRHGIPGVSVPRLATWPEAADRAAASGADVLISTAFPHLVPASVLNVFPQRAVNLHPALLPRYRGPTPIHSMLADRTVDTCGGVTLHVMDDAFDTGGVIAQARVPFPADRDVQAFSLALSVAAGRLAAEDLPRYLAGEVAARPQDETLATYDVMRRRDVSLGRGLEAERVRWLCDTLAWLTPLAVQGTSGVRVRWFDRVLRPPTGEPPRVRHLAVDFDAADARVRVRRDSRLARLWIGARRRLLRIRS